MNKTAIKNYAIWARVQLIEAAKQKAYEYAVTDGENVRELNAIGGRLLTETEKKQRRELLDKIRSKGYQQVMEEAAYTWFNRFIALRFMEVNGYLPSMVRVFTDETGAFKPEILKEAMTVDLPGLDRAKVLDLIDKQNNDELYQYLLITQCNALNDCLPWMFERIDNWTELLFPKNLLRPDGVLGKMISMIPEEDWTDQVQIIGWLYQYYNTEPKDKVFENLKKNIKISKENIPAATQLFTPDWIVHYMVENSLGRLWVEGHPNEEMKKSWKYYLEEAEQEPEVQKQLAEIRREYAKLNPEDIKVIDPCMGSGHILVVLFDVLLQIYESCGYSAREAVSLIVEKNLYGLDIDERAAQLAYFAVMMKARKHDRRFFTRGVQPRVYAIRESNDLDRTTIDYFVNRDFKLKAAMDTLTRELYDAKEYGSILNVSRVDFPALYARFKEIKQDNNILSQFALIDLLPFVQIAEAMAQKYHTVITNPPYMGGNGMSAKLSMFVKKHYPASKSDLFSCFIEQGGRMANRIGNVSMITMESWMFLSSFEKMRCSVISNSTLTSMVHMPYLGKGGTSLGINFGTAAFVIFKHRIENYKGVFDYVRYYETNEEGVPFSFPVKNERYKIAKTNDFLKIPGAPIAYWFSNHAFSLFEREKSFGEVAATKSGLSTTDNNRFVRMWQEVSFSSIGFKYKTLKETEDCQYRFIPHQKGGEYRKWYGNLEYLVDWYDNGAAIKKAAEGASGGRIVGSEYYLREGLTWTDLTSTGKISVRFAEAGTIFNSSGPMCFCFKREDQNVVLGYLNSVVAREFLKLLAPTFHFNGGPISKLPYLDPGIKKDRINQLVSQNIKISKDDWDAFEGSWNYKRSPLVRGTKTIEEAFLEWEKECESRFSALKHNEEELNRIFVDLYGMSGELDTCVEEQDVTVRRADLKRDIRRLISYAVGCMFGRYSLSQDGLIYAGGKQNQIGAMDCLDNTGAIIPICDDEYFSDDIVGRFICFLETAYGRESLEQNLHFIASALGGNGSSREIIREYFLTDFYSDHCSIYSVASSGKRPIYWLFDSGKKNGFKCLIYMHRYQPDTIARIRTDYVHEQQERYRSQIQMIEDAMQTASTAERVKLNKQLTKFKDQALELQKYEEKIHHLADQAIAIDLDDGVKVNYAKFEDVLAKIK